MSESNPHRSNSPSSSGTDVKSPNIFERVVEGIDEMLHIEKPPHHHKESHGMRDNIDENTPLNDVKSPDMFERAKEEIEAFVQTIHPKKESTRNEAIKEEFKTYSSADVKVDTEARVKVIHPNESSVGTKLDSVSGTDVKSPNHIEKPPHHHKESHGTRDDIDENTPLNDVKAPNMFERAKEEIEAFVQTIHPNKESTRNEAIKEESKTCSSAENGVKTPISIEKTKEKDEAIQSTEKSQVHHRHHKETHGTSDDIDENTPIEVVKGPNVFERAKEELEALVQTIHPQKEKSDLHVSESKKESGFVFNIGRGLEKMCRPWGTKKN